MAAIIRGRRDALAKLELEFTVGQNTPYEPHPDIESRWADLMAHMWLSEEERLSYIRELRERKAARKLEHKAKRGDSEASAQVQARKEKEQAALKAAQAKVFPAHSRIKCAKEGSSFSCTGGVPRRGRADVRAKPAHTSAPEARTRRIPTLAIPGWRAQSTKAERVPGELRRASLLSRSRTSPWAASIPR